MVLGRNMSRCFLSTPYLEVAASSQAAQAHKVHEFIAAMQLNMRISLALVAATSALAPSKVAPATKTALARKAASTAGGGA